MHCQYDWLPLLLGKKFKPEKIIFRTDGAKIPLLSFGHLMRSALRARILYRRFKIRTCFIVKDYPESIEFLTKSGFEFEAFNQALDELSIVKSFMTTQPRCLFIYDLPWSMLPSELFAWLSAQHHRTVYIDDWRFTYPVTDIYWNTNILAPKHLIRRTESTAYLLGTDYFLLDEDQRGTSDICTGDVKIVVSMGGSDPHHLTEKILTTLNTRHSPWFSRIGLTVVVGPGFGPSDHLLAEYCQLNMQVVIAPEKIYPYFRAADFVLCAGGQTLYELNALAVKAFPIASCEHEARNIHAFIDIGKVTTGMLHWDEEVFYTKFVSLVMSTLQKTSPNMTS